MTHFTERCPRCGKHIRFTQEIVYVKVPGRERMVRAHKKCPEYAKQSTNV